MLQARALYARQYSSGGIWASSGQEGPVLGTRTSPGVAPWPWPAPGTRGQLRAVGSGSLHTQAVTCMGREGASRPQATRASCGPSRRCPWVMGASSALLHPQRRGGRCCFPGPSLGSRGNGAGILLPLNPWGESAWGGPCTSPGPSLPRRTGVWVIPAPWGGKMGPCPLAFRCPRAGERP